MLLFPDWKVVHEVENTPGGAKELYDALDGKAEGRQRSWVLPYRAVILLCKLWLYPLTQAPTSAEISDAT